MRFGLVNSFYRGLVYPAGKRYLQKALAQGLAPEWAEPLSFLLTGRLSPADRQVVRRVEAIRTLNAQKPDTYIFQTVASDLGAQNFVRIVVAAPSGASQPKLSSGWVAKVASVSADWGTFLYLAAKAAEAQLILELGSCAGISGCYLASAPNCSQFITIEGSPALAALATANIQQISEKATVINALFDSGLDQVLAGLNRNLDFVFIDGHHELEATRHYFERLQPHLSETCIVVFDDIRLYHSMWEFWQSLSCEQGFTQLINVGRFGIGLWNGVAAQPQVFDFSPFTGLWRIGGRRTEAATFN